MSLDENVDEEKREMKKIITRQTFKTSKSRAKDKRKRGNDNEEMSIDKLFQI